MRPLFLLMLSLATTMLIAAPAARAQNASDPTIYVVRYIEVMPGSKNQGADLLKQLATESRKDAGALRFDVLERIAPANQFAIFETWKDQQALDTHMGAAHTKKFLDTVAPLLLAPIDDRPCIAIDAAPAQSAGGNAVIAITHVDVIPPSRDSALVMLKSAASASRMEKGNLGFDVLQQTARSNHFEGGRRLEQPQGRGRPRERGRDQGLARQAPPARRRAL